LLLTDHMLDDNLDPDLKTPVLLMQCESEALWVFRLALSVEAVKD
jgi:hypothetical protein